MNMVINTFNSLNGDLGVVREESNLKMQLICYYILMKQSTTRPLTLNTQENNSKVNLETISN